MKIQCQLCKEIVTLDGFVLGETGIDITCGACRGSFHVAAEASTAIRAQATVDVAPAMPAPVGDEMRCPKCREVQRQAPACKTCGLSSDRFADFASSAADEPAGSAELDAAWQECRDCWEDSAAHERFIEATSVNESFAYSARRYREVLSERPDDEIAARQLARLSRMTEALLVGAVAARQTGTDEPEPYKNVMILLMVLVLVGGVLGVWLLLRGATSDPPTKLPQPAPSAEPRR